MSTEKTFFNNAEKKGWLIKQGGRIKTWRRRYFVLKDFCFFYFKDSKDEEPCGVIPLENVVVGKVSKEITKRYSFVLTYASQGQMKAMRMRNGIASQGNHRYYLLAGDSEPDINEWIVAINSNIHRNPFYELISDRKKKAIRGTKMPTKIN